MQNLINSTDTGMTDDPDVRIATSVLDYLFRRLALDHLPYEKRAQLGIFSSDERSSSPSTSMSASLVSASARVRTSLAFRASSEAQVRIALRCLSLRSRESI